MEAKIKLSTRKKARIEIIPLIDVIFFLLATFVLFTLSLNRIQSVPLNLPVAAPPQRERSLKSSPFRFLTRAIFIGTANS